MIRLHIKYTFILVVNLGMLLSLWEGPVSALPSKPIQNDKKIPNHLLMQSGSRYPVFGTKSIHGSASLTPPAPVLTSPPPVYLTSGLLNIRQTRPPPPAPPPSPIPPDEQNQDIQKPLQRSLSMTASSRLPSRDGRNRYLMPPPLRPNLKRHRTTNTDVVANPFTIPNTASSMTDEDFEDFCSHFYNLYASSPS